MSASDGNQPVRTPARRRTRPCGWCGRSITDGDSVGRRRRYCGQSCRQRAYERRTAVQRGGLPQDAVVFSTDEISNLQDRLFQLRCAAEDVLTAAQDGASTIELTTIAGAVVESARDLERIR